MKTKVHNKRGVCVVKEREKKSTLQRIPLTCAVAIVVLRGFDAHWAVCFTGFASVRAASYICTYVHVCEAARLSLSHWN